MMSQGRMTSSIMARSLSPVANPTQHTDFLFKEAFSVCQNPDRRWAKNDEQSRTFVSTLSESGKAQRSVWIVSVAC
jgi:hypothetical protein